MDFSVEKESRQGISNLSDHTQIVCAFPMNLPQGFSSVCNCADLLCAFHRCLLPWASAKIKIIVPTKKQKVTNFLQLYPFEIPGNNNCECRDEALACIS